MSELGRTMHAHPPAARTIADLLALRADDPFAEQRLAAVMETDTTVLQRIQRAYFDDDRGTTERPFTPRDAIRASGYRAVHSGCVGVLFVDAAAYYTAAARAAASWRWPYARALTAAVISEATRRQPDLAFAAAFAESACRVGLGLQPEDGGGREQPDPPLPAEETRLLAASWGVPEPIVAVVAGEAPHTTLARLVELADVVARRIGLGVPRTTPLAAAAVDEAERAVGGYVTLLGGLDRYQRRIDHMMAAANLTRARAA